MNDDQVLSTVQEMLDNRAHTRQLEELCSRRSTVKDDVIQYEEQTCTMTSDDVNVGLSSNKIVVAAVAPRGSWDVSKQTRLCSVHALERRKVNWMVRIKCTQQLWSAMLPQ